MPVINFVENKVEAKRTITDVIDIYEEAGDDVRASLYKIMRKTLKDMKKTVKMLTEIIESM